MTQNQLLNRFRLGITRIYDKQTGRTYVATGLLEKKIKQFRITLFMSLVVIPLPLIFIMVNGLREKLTFGLFLYLFEIVYLFFIGRIMITKKDLSDVIEE